MVYYVITSDRKSDLVVKVTCGVSEIHVPALLVFPFVVSTNTFVSSLHAQSEDDIFLPSLRTALMKAVHKTPFLYLKSSSKYQVL